MTPDQAVAISSNIKADIMEVFVFKLGVNILVDSFTGVVSFNFFVTLVSSALAKSNAVRMEKFILF